MRVLSTLILATAALHSVHGALTPFNYGYFVTSATDVLCQQFGLYTAVNLNVTSLAVPNSVAAYQSLQSGQYNVLAGSFDNTLNYDVNYAPQFPLNFTVIGGADVGAGLGLWSLSGITTPQQLKGAVIGIDAPTSGFVYVLQKLLAVYGLQVGRDFTYVKLGSTPNRLAAIQAGTINATILTYPYTEMLTVSNPTGLNELISVNDFLPNYQSGAYHVNTAILSNTNGVQYQAAVNFTAAQLAARQLLQVAQTYASVKTAVIQALATGFAVDIPTATLLYTDAIGPYGNLANVNLGMTDAQILTTAYIRQEVGQFTSFGGSATSVTDISDLLNNGTGHLINYQIRDAATALLAQLEAAYF